MGIMHQAHVIGPGVLDHLHVPPHLLLGQCVPAVVAPGVVAADTDKEVRFPIEQETIALFPQLLEAHPLAQNVQRLSAVQQLDFQRVEMG